MYKIAQLLLTPGQRSANASDIYLAQPEADKEALAGKLFILAEIKGERDENRRIIDFLFRELPDSYYQNEKLYLLEKLTTLRIEHIFESSLSKFNQQWAAFLETEKIRFDPSTLSVMAGILHEDEIIFTVRGGPRAFLIYPDRSDPKGGRYKLVDIAKEAATDEVTEAGKLFLSVFSGRLPAGSYFLAANETVPEYLTHRQITDIITTLPPPSAAEQMKQVLSQVNAYVSFLGVIVKNIARDEFASTLPAAPRPAYAETRDSIAGLKATEETTERLLAPSGLVKAGRISDWFGGLWKKPSAKKLPGPGFDLVAKATRQRRLLVPALAKTGEFFRLAGLAALNGGRYLFSLSVKRGERQAAVVDLRSGLGERLRWFRSLSWKNRILIGIAAASLLVLAFNLIYLRAQKERVAAEAAYKELTETIRQKQDQIESSLVYRNDETALRLYAEIQELIKGLPQETDAEKESYRTIESRLEEQAERFRKVERPATTLVADLSAVNAAAGPDRIFRHEKEGDIYAADDGLKTIFLIDRDTKEAEAIAAVGGTTADFRTGVLGDDRLFLLGGDGLLAFDTKSKAFASVAFKAAEPATDLSWYNGRIYSLARDGRIFRYQAAGSGFSAGTAWLREAPAAGEAVAMDIDSQIFVGTASGTVARYQNGRPAELKLSPLEPPLASLDRIVARPDAKYLYVLDRAGARLVVFEKTGAFLVQYLSDDLKDWQDVAIDEAGKTIYGLSGAKIYSFKGSHWGQ